MKRQPNRFLFTAISSVALLALLVGVTGMSLRVIGSFWSNIVNLAIVQQILPSEERQGGWIISGHHLTCLDSPSPAAQVVNEWQSRIYSSHSTIIVSYAWRCGTPELTQRTIDWINTNRPTTGTLADIWLKYYQGAVYYAQGKLDRAIETWRVVPNSGWYFASIGSGLYDQDRTTALRYYEISERLDPGWKKYRVEFYWKQCLDLYNQKQYDAALPNCQAAVEFQPHAAYLLTLGQVYAARQEYAFAMETFDRALQAGTATDGIAGYAHRGKQLVYQKLGNDAQAQAELQMAAQLLPDDPWVQIALGDLYLEQKDFTAAQTVFERVLSLADVQAQTIAAGRLKQISAPRQ